MELAFASLHLLCAPLLDRLEDLPGPQHDALGVAFGLREGAAPDRFLVGLVFAAREPGEPLRGLADLELRGLPDQDAGTLLSSVVGFGLDERARDRILAVTNGNQHPFPTHALPHATRCQTSTCSTLKCGSPAFASC